MRTSTTISRRNRSGFLRALGVDLRRAVLSCRFLMTIVLLLAWMLYNSAKPLFVNKTLFTSGISYVLSVAADGSLGLGMLMLSIATVPYATSYLVDRECGFDRHAIERVGFTAYSVSRVISVVLSAFLAFVIAGGLFLLGLILTGAPQVIPQPEEYLNCVYSDLAVTVGPWCYYLVRFTLSGLTCAMAAVFSLFVTTLFPNRYVALLSPLVASYAYAPLLYIFYLIFGDQPVFHLLNLDYVITIQVSQDNGFSFLWAVVYQLTVIILCGRGFCHRLRKEQGL